MRGNRQVSWRLFMLVVLVMGGALVAVGLSASGPGVADSYDIVYVDVYRLLEVHPTMAQVQEEYVVEQEEIYLEFEELFEERPEEAYMLEYMVEERLQILEYELMDRVFIDLKGDLSEVAGEYGFDYILDREIVLHGGEDVTNLVLEHIEGKYQR